MGLEKSAALLPPTTPTLPPPLRSRLRLTPRLVMSLLRVGVSEEGDEEDAVAPLEKEEEEAFVLLK